MASTTAAVEHGAGEHHRNPYLAHHFDSIETQNYATRLGMWLFLATEVLLFGGIFLGYTVYRWLYHDAFRHASADLDIWMGTINTIVLITSSLTVAIALDAVKKDQNKKAAGLLIFTILCAIGFLVIKYFEYAHKIHEGQLPGRFYAYGGNLLPGANMYYTIYFLSTGLHALHVIIGMTILLFVLRGVMKGKYNSQNNVGVELGGLYWHLVDLVWIFLFPLLYLI